MQCSIKKAVLCEATKKDNVVHTTVYSSLTQIEKWMRAPVLIQQFLHLVCIPIALAPLSGNYPRLSYLLCGQDRKNTRHTDKGKHSRIRFRRKAKSPPSPSRIELLLLLSRSCLSLLPAIRQSRKLLASAGLYFRSCCFVVVVYPDVWSKQNTLLLRACAVEA